MIEIQRSADFSPCRTWRYTLIRQWDDRLPRVLFILLNPSTADEYQDDPTNRRGIAFAVRWGYGSVVFCNLYAIRSSDPSVILQVDDPVGPDNDSFIRREARNADKIVCAWGSHKSVIGRDAEIYDLLASLGSAYYHLGLTKDGHPKHPLYLRKDVQPCLFHQLRYHSGWR